MLYRLIFKVTFDMKCEHSAQWRTKQSALVLVQTRGPGRLEAERLVEGPMRFTTANACYSFRSLCCSVCQQPENFADRKLYLLLYPTLRRSSNLASNVTASSVTPNFPVSKSRKRGPIRPRFFVKQSAIMCMRSIQSTFVKLTKLLSASARQTLFSCPPRRQSHWLKGRRVTWHPQWPKHFRLVRTTLQSLTVFISHISVIRALPRERPTNEILWAPTTQEPTGLHNDLMANKK